MILLSFINLNRWIFFAHFAELAFGTFNTRILRGDVLVDKIKLDRQLRATSGDTDMKKITTVLKRSILNELTPIPQITHRVIA
jgi:hypothetical protein